MSEPKRDYELEEILGTYRLDGSLIRAKARVLTEEGLDELYVRMRQGELSTASFLDIMKYLAEVGDLKPKQSQQQAQAGPGFSITINIPQTDGKPPITLTAEDVSSKPSDESDGDVGGVRLGLGDVPLNKLSDLTSDD